MIKTIQHCLQRHQQLDELAVLYPEPRTEDVPPPPADCALQTLHCGGITFFMKAQTTLAGQETSQDILSALQSLKGQEKNHSIIQQPIQAIVTGRRIEMTAG